jgi:proteasome lid subunit RPN8/RPN11
MIVSPTTIVAIKAHAMREFPREACGAITRTGYVPMENRSETPEIAFDCADECAALQVRGDVLALVHSHPNGPDHPSAADIAQQTAMGIPWGLVTTDGMTASAPWFWGDQIEPPPLEGRSFRHGPSGTDGRGDCYALVRDWYRLNRGVILKDYPREFEWWNKPGANLYLRNFEDAGFHRVAGGVCKEPQVGDVVIGQILTPEPCHAGVYVGNGMILHHLINRLSRVDSVHMWAKFIVCWVRYGDAG